MQGASALLLLASVVTARADAVSAPFEQANKLYEEGHYTEAAAAYQSLLDHGSVSPAIYFNAGNALFKAGQIGRAIYNYRRAEELAPRDPDIRANLQIARTQAGTNTASAPGNRWTRWTGRLTLNEWTDRHIRQRCRFFLPPHGAPNPASTRQINGRPDSFAWDLVRLVVDMPRSVN